MRDFLGTETGSALFLVGAVIVALLWANVDFGSYSELWETHLSIQVGSHGIDNDLRAWVNEGLMTLFFLVVGLEAKREIDLGELREHNRLWYPALAALGGVAGAVGIYLLFNAGGDGGSGWGVAMSTDTALALGVLALVAPTGSTRLRVFLLTLVVFDDLAALADHRRRLHRLDRRDGAGDRGRPLRRARTAALPADDAGTDRGRSSARRSGWRCTSRGSTR